MLKEMESIEKKKAARPGDQGPSVPQAAQESAVALIRHVMARFGVVSPVDGGDAVVAIAPEAMVAVVDELDGGAHASHIGAMLRRLAARGLLAWAGDAPGVAPATLLLCLGRSA